MARQYPAYKDSGTVWLGSVPDTWALGPLGKHFQERKETVSDTEFAPLSVTMQGIVPQLDTAAKTDNGDNRKGVEPGDFVINSRSDRKGSAGVSPLRGSVSVISIVLKPRDVDPGFAHHLLRSEPFQEEFYRYGSGIVADLWSTRYSSMKQITVAIPPSDEQSAIARYLDNHTAKLDLLIQKQEQLIETLAERRQAVISHAVTRGLDPSVSLWDSGVEFLGEIPSGWHAKPLIAISEVLVSTVDKKSHEGQVNVRLCNYTDVYRNDVIVQRDSYMRATASLEQIARFSVMKGDVPITKDSETSTDVGISAYVTQTLPGTVYGYHLAIYRPRDGRYGRFLKWLFDAHFVKTSLQVRTPGVTRVGLNRNTLRYLRVPIPPARIALEVADYLDGETTRIDALSAKAREMIDVLKERRQALISAAVTGKIDVRGLS